jgi:hypothetical protein
MHVMWMRLTLHHLQTLSMKIGRAWIHTGIHTGIHSVVVHCGDFVFRAIFFAAPVASSKKENAVVVAA